jgi:hypothetical protein
MAKEKPYHGLTRINADWGSDAEGPLLQDRTDERSRLANAEIARRFVLVGSVRAAAAAETAASAA